MSLYAAWQGMKDVAGSRDQAMMGLKKAFGTYNYAEDPEYQRDMQILSQNPTQQALGAFYEKWGDNLDGKTLQDVATSLSYVKNTPQWYENQMLINAHKRDEIDTQLYPEFTDIELGLAQNRKALSDNELYYAPKFSEQRLNQNEQALIQGEQAINENSIRLKYLEPQIKQNLTAGEIANDIGKLDLRLRQETDPLKIQMLEYDKTLAENTLQDKIALSGLQVDNAEQTLRQNTSAANVAERTEEAAIRSAVANSYMDALRKSLFEDTYEAQVNRPYIQNQGLVLDNQGRVLSNEGARINNFINRETAQAQIQAPYIRNSGAVLDNNRKVTLNRILNETADYQITQADLETELMRLQQQQAEDEYNFMKNLDDNLRFGVQTGDSGPAIDIKEFLPTPEGVPQLALNAADTVVYAQNGQPYIDSEGKSYVAQKDIFGSNRTFKSVDPNSYLAGGTGTLDDFRQQGQREDEPGWIGQTWNNIVSNITGENAGTANQVSTPEELLRNFKAQTSSDTPLTTSQIKGKIALIPDQKFEQLYGIPKSQFMDYLNRF